MADRENYKGSIELISGLIPKNNGSFPLMHACDVQVDDTGKRLDEKLAEIGNGGTNSGVSFSPSIANEFKLRYKFYYYSDLYDALADLSYGSPENGLTVEIENAVCAIYYDEANKRNVLILLNDITVPQEAFTLNNPIEINFAGNYLIFSSCEHQWTFTNDAYLNAIYGGGVIATITADGASYPLNFEGDGSLVVNGGSYELSGGSNHTTSSAVLLYTKNTMESVTIKNATFKVNYGGTSNCYAVVCNAIKNHVENVSVNVNGVDGVVAQVLYGMLVSSAVKGEANVSNCSIEVQAKEIGTKTYGISLNKQSVATLTNNTVYADAGNNGAENDGLAIAVAITSACEKVIINGGSYAGTHSAINTNACVIVDGGKFVSCSHGGIYFAHPNKTSYIKNATLGIEYTGIFDTASMENPIPFSPFYIGGSTGNDNIAVHMDNCTFLCTDNTRWSGGVVRGTSGEINGRLYISNTIVPSTAEYGANLRIDNGNYAYVGAGTNITDDIIVAGTASVIQTPTADAVTYTGNRTYTYENEYTNEKIDEFEVIEGEQGESGATFTPSVSSEGVLSWTNDKGLENPTPVNIKGEKGDKGEQGTGVNVKASASECVEIGDAYIDSLGNLMILTGLPSTFTNGGQVKGPKGDKGDKGDTGDAGTNGKDGADGTSVTVKSVSESTIDGGSNVVTFSDGKTVTIKNGSKGTKGDTGSQGETGASGKDGVSVSSVKQTTTSTADGGSNVITVTLSNGTTSTFTVKNGSKGSAGAKGDKGDTGETGASGADGKDGYTPVKEIDYWTPTDKAEIIQAVLDAIGCPVFGIVDENNNIILTGDIPDGTYTVKYEMEDGDTINIGNLVLDTNVYYSVTKNLTQCSISNSATKVVEGGSYSATITANSGYELKTVTVTMGGSAVSVTNGVINIASVTGNIVITAVAEVREPAYNNLLPQAVDANGNDFVGTHANGGDGYEYGYRISKSSGVQSAQTGVYCSGFIPATRNDVIRIKGITAAGTDTYNVIAFYDSSKAYVAGLYNLSGNDHLTINGDLYTITPNKTIDKDFAFFRFSCGSITDNTIVTVNQPIE